MGKGQEERQSGKGRPPGRDKVGQATILTYKQLKTNRGKLASWKKLIGKVERDVWRSCKRGSETRRHLVFDCKH